MFLTKEGIIKWKRDLQCHLSVGNYNYHFCQIPSPCLHGGRWGKTLIGAQYFYAVVYMPKAPLSL